MRLNWLGYGYSEKEGYGRFSNRLIRALQRRGVRVRPICSDHTSMPQWMLAQEDIDWDDLTISCVPPYELTVVPGRHWLYTMTEGSELPGDWAELIAKSGVERVIVPCQTNAETFRRGGVTIPIDVIPGGTDPDEFPLHTGIRYPERPFTVLCLADRASRKGWMEVWKAFYKAFGPHTTGQQDVRLIVKCRPDGNSAISMLMRANNRDPRIAFQEQDFDCAREMYAQADVVALPSRFEGWGMPHREAAMMGIPVITQRYSGMDDGHTEEWAIVLKKGRVERIPVDGEDFINGEWMRADTEELAGVLRTVYFSDDRFATFGAMAAEWLRANQTWEHSAARLLQLIEAHHAPQRHELLNHAAMQAAGG